MSDVVNNRQEGSSLHSFRPTLDDPALLLQPGGLYDSFVTKMKRTFP